MSIAGAPLYDGELSVGNSAETLMISSALSARHDWETEWWYYHGHLHHGGRPYGFHAAFFRRRADDVTIGRLFPVRYAAKHVWFAHFALTDLTARRFRYGQRRSMFGPAGAACDRYHVWPWRPESRSRTAQGRCCSRCGASSEPA